jgi:CRP-like cAMP-binding protein
MLLTLAEARKCGNRLLNKLADEHFKPLLPHLEKTHLKSKEVIYERGQPFSYVHFPCDSALSNLIYLEDGTAVEVGTVGNEGFSSVELLVNASLAVETCLCQIEGKSLRMKVADFQKELSNRTPLRHLAECYLQAYLAQVSQSVACNRMHTIEARFARWLLVTHDRVRGEEFYLTQEFVAEMLGVHRPSVSLIAGAFQNAGIIQYRRGHMKILDRAALEETSCECYEAVTSQFKRLLGIPYG